MLFRKSAEPTLCYPKDNDVKYEFDYLSVMQFISKNKIIPEKLAAFSKSEEDMSKIKMLEKVIQAGEFTHTLFSDPNCQNYILFLFKENKLSLENFITLNFYLIALRQYTDKQQLAERDADVKGSRTIEIVSLDDPLIRESIVQDFKKKHDEMHPDLKFDMTVFQAEYKKFDLCAKLTLKMNIPREMRWTDEETFLSELASLNMPLQKIEGHYYIYSASLINALTKSFNPNCPVKLAPIFGNVNLFTLYKFHQLGLHPVNLYSPDVTTNPATVHKVRIGPSPTIFHDPVHMYFGNLFTPEQHHLIFDYLIPKISSLLNQSFNQLTDEGTIFFMFIDFFAIQKPSRGFIYEILDKFLAIHENFYPQLDNETRQKIFAALYADKDMLKETYQVDLEEIMKHPSMNDYKARCSGKELLLSIEKPKFNIPHA